MGLSKTPSTSQNSETILDSHGDVKPIIPQGIDLQGNILKLNRDDYTALVTWINQQYDKADSARSRIKRRWYINLAFYFGQQNVQEIKTPGSGTGYKLVVPPAPSWRARPVVNRVRPIVRTEIAKLTSQKPTAQVIPASSDDEDLMAAQAGEQIWESASDRLKFADKLRSAIWWTSICGTGYIKDYWDWNKVDKSLPADSQVQGDFCLDRVSPFHLLVPDLQCEEIEDEPWVMQVAVKDLEWVKSRYKEALDGKEFKPTNSSSEEDILSQAFLNYSSRPNPEAADKCFMKEVWIKPGGHRMFPQGGMVTMIDDQLVQGYAIYPYQHGEFPFTKINHIPTGSYYGSSVVEDLVPLQRELNRTHGQIIEAKNKAAKPQFVAVEGSVDPSKITTEPGQYILYKAGFQPPAPMPIQPIPNYVIQELELLQNAIEDVSGQHEVSNGRTPPGVTAATAISFLQEQDDTKLSLTIDNIEDACEKIGRHILSMANQYWDIPRMVKVTGTDGSFYARMFSSADLRGNTDIRIEAGSALPTSRAARQAYIMDLMKLGFIEPTEGLRLMDIGGVQQIYNGIKIDEAAARRENMLMQSVDEMMYQQFQQENTLYTDEMGQEVPPDDPRVQMQDPSIMVKEPPPMVPVNTWDNHQVHIEIHNKYRKSQSFDVAPEHVKMLFEQHVQMHMAAIAAPAQGGMPPANMMQGVAAAQDQGLALPGGSPPGPEQAPTGEEGAAPPEQAGPAGLPGPPPELEEAVQNMEKPGSGEQQRKQNNPNPRRRR